MKFTFAGREWTLLSETTAMSCYSWSLPAVASCPGRVANNSNDICYGCYAQIGRYGLPQIMDTQAARLAWTIESLKTKREKEWITTLVMAIRKVTKNQPRKQRYFRWHDSGDIFSPTYCRMIIEVCKRTPEVRHWLPTRSWRLPWVDVIRELASLPNVIVRPSALTFDDAAPVVDGLGKGSTAITSLDRLPKGHRLCPKTTANYQEASCKSVGCRRCWESRQPVAYYVHGRRGLHDVHHASEKEQRRRTDAVNRMMGLVVLDS